MSSKEEFLRGAMMMKKFLFACAAATSLSSAANATVYSVDVTAAPFFQVPEPTGLQTRAVVLSPSGPQGFTGATYTVELAAIGDSESFDIYGLVSFDTPINVDDLTPLPTSATFDFGGAIGSLTISGLSYAVGSGTAGYAIAQFVSGMIQVAPATAIRITLADTIFATDGQGNFVTGRPGIGFVNANFELASIPVPAALPLSLTALGLMGFVARRRKVKPELV